MSIDVIAPSVAIKSGRIKDGFLANGNGWVALPKLGSLLKSVAELKHAPIGVVAAYNLQAHGQAIGCKAARHGERRVAGGADEVAGLHPINVGF